MRQKLCQSCDCPSWDNMTRRGKHHIPTESQQLSGCMTLGRLLSFSEHQFSRLSNAEKQCQL